MSQHQLPDSPSSTHHHEKWLQLPLPLLDTYRPRVTVKRRDDGAFASLAASLTMDSLLNFGKPFSDEEISTTFQDILGSDTGPPGLAEFSGLGLVGVTSFSAIPKGFPNFTPIPPPPGPQEMLMCMKCKRDGSVRPLIECNDCKKRYHLNCHRPAVTDVELMDPRGIWLCAECSLAKKIAAPLPKSEEKESLKMTFCKYTSGVPLKNEKEIWRTQRREPLKSPEELFPSLMSAAAAIEPLAFQKKPTDTIRIDRRKTTPTGQPAGLAAWAAKCRAAKMAKKGKAKAPETIVRSPDESPGSTSPDSTVETPAEENDVKVTKVVIRGKRFDKRLADLLNEAKHVIGDSLPPYEGRRTRSQTALHAVVKVEPMEVDYVNDDMEMPELQSEVTLPVFIPEVPAKRNRIGSRGRPVKKQLKLTINLAKERVSYKERDAERKLKKPKKAKRKSEKRSSRRKDKERVSCIPVLKYLDKSSDEEDFEPPQTLMRIPGLTFLSE